jgi:hypothetical protein
MASAAGSCQQRGHDQHLLPDMLHALQTEQHCNLATNAVKQQSPRPAALAAGLQTRLPHARLQPRTHPTTITLIDAED